MQANFKEHSICALLLRNEKRWGQKIYLKQPYKGKWSELTWEEVLRLSRQVASFLYSKGLKRGDHVAIVSKNCAEWFITDFGIALAGMVNIPLFANQNQDSIEYVLNHSETKLIFLGKLDDYQRIQNDIPKSYPTVSYNYHKGLKTDYVWEDVLKCEPLTDINPPEPDDLYTIIYSSGTTGLPKGAVYTHQALANYLALFSKDIKRISDVDQYHLISYLPLAHVYERTAIELGSLTIPSDVSFIESLEKFADNLRDIQPTLFAAVPRVWGVFQQKIEQKLPSKKMNLLLKIPFISHLIKKKIRNQLGLGRCTNCFSGASHLPDDILNFFDQLDIRIQEGYGQTENLAYVSFNQLDAYRAGYVGSPRLGVKIKKGENNELLMHSDCLMKEYFKNEQATKQTFTEEGWLKTGDIVEIDDKNRIKILGRLSETFKNQKGEFVTPGPIEQRFMETPWIEYRCLVGQELPSNVLLVNLSETGSQQPKKRINDYLKAELHRVNSDLQKYEKISHAVVVSDQWTIDNNYITPTLKVKRPVVNQKYKDIVKEAVQDRGPVVWE